jgi:hypothetical protein
MSSNWRPKNSSIVQLSGMLLGLTVGPLATPTLIWATLTVDLPVTLVIFLLIVVAMSNCLLYITLRDCALVEDRSDEVVLDLPGRCARHVTLIDEGD